MSTEPPLTNHALAFLKMLDPKTDRFCFRTFPEAPTAKITPWAPKKLGTLSEYYSAIKSRNEQGAGVGVVINEGGQKNADIARVRAVFADTDGADLAPIVAALPPHIIVNTSPGKWHVYWLVTDDFPLGQFRAVQLAIAEKFSTDKKVADLPHVMRLPGFHHNKAEPYPVTITDFDAQLARYPFDEVVSGLGLDLTAVSQRAARSSVDLAHRKSEVWRKALKGQYTKHEIEEMLSFIDPDCDRKEWIDIIFILADELGENGRELADRWSRGDLWQGSLQ